MLYNPQGIFVDSNLNLYVADFSNNRIQFFLAGQLSGTTIAGNGVSISLYGPSGITLDADGYLFTVDCSNSRVVGSGPNGFRCLVGCSGYGSASDQLWNPQGLSFDSYGNMFVTDGSNYRIQKFFLATNSCGKCHNTKFKK
jgi:DNA-binding beta-propeller fold protein YncE